MPQESRSTSAIPVSVVVPTYGRHDILCDTLNSILQQRWRTMEIVVVDQTPGTPSALRELVDRHPGVIHYHKQIEPNLPRARNTGVRLARFDTLIFIDDDVLLPESFIEKHVHRLHADDRTGAVTGPAVSDFSEGGAPVGSPLIKTFDLEPSIQQLGYSAASWFGGCNFSVKRAVLEKTGPFDESFTGSAYCEDVDMGVRVRETGFRVMYDRDAWLVHLALQSGGCETRNPERAEQRARERFRHLLYCRLKHRKIQGAALSVRLIYLAYRTYLLNRSSVARGLVFAIERIRATAVESWRVLQRLKDTPTERPGWTRKPI